MQPRRLCLTDKANVQPRPQLKTAVMDFVCSHSLPFCGIHPCNACKYMNCYSYTDPKGWKAESANPRKDRPKAEHTTEECDTL